MVKFDNDNIARRHLIKGVRVNWEPLRGAWPRESFVITRRKHIFVPRQQFLVSLYGATSMAATPLISFHANFLFINKQNQRKNKNIFWLTNALTSQPARVRMENFRSQNQMHFAFYTVAQ